LASLVFLSLFLFLSLLPPRRCCSLLIRPQDLNCDINERERGEDERRRARESGSKL
jgi:hypothetical protein